MTTLTKTLNFVPFETIQAETLLSQLFPIEKKRQSASNKTQTNYPPPSNIFVKRIREQKCLLFHYWGLEGGCSISLLAASSDDDQPIMVLL